MTDHGKLLRVLKMIRLLNSKKRGISVKDLSLECNISERSVYRYFRTFAEAGLYIDIADDPEGRLYRIKRTTEDFSEIIEFLPEADSKRKKVLPTETIASKKNPNWLIFDMYSNDIFSFDTLPNLLYYFPVDSETNVYSRLNKKKDVLNYGHFKIRRCPYFYSKRKTKYRNS